MPMDEAILITDISWSISPPLSHPIIAQLAILLHDNIYELNSSTKKVISQYAFGSAITVMFEGEKLLKMITAYFVRAQAGVNNDDEDIIQ